MAAIQNYYRLVSRYEHKAFETAVQKRLCTAVYSYVQTYITIYIRVALFYSLKISSKLDKFHII